MEKVVSGSKWEEWEQWGKGESHREGVGRARALSLGDLLKNPAE